MNGDNPRRKLQELRASLHPLQRALLNRISLAYFEDRQGIPLRILHHEFGASATQAQLKALNGAIVYEFQDYAVGNRYQPTIVGLLLSEHGADYEGLMVGYLEYLELLFRTNPRQQIVTSDEIGRHLDLSANDLKNLCTLIDRSSLYSNCASFGNDGKWQVGILKESELLPEWVSKEAFLHTWIFRNYNPKVSVYLNERHPYVITPKSVVNEQAPPKKTITRKRKRDFFISYNKADLETAKRIQGWLESAGFTTYMQESDFHSGSNFVLKMDEGMKTTNRTLAVLSKNYLGSNFTPVEWSEAFSRDPKGEHGLLLVVKIDDCDVTGILGVTIQVRLERLVALEDWEEARRILLTKVEKLPALRKRSAPEAKPQAKREGESPQAEQQPGINQIAKGKNILQAGRDIHQNFYTKAPKREVVIKPRDGAVSSEKAQEIQFMIERLVDGTVGMSRESAFKMWWRRFKLKFKLDKYQELPSDRFFEAQAWFKQQSAISKRSLRNKAPEAWRKERYATIHAAMEKMGVDKLAYYSHISERLKMKKPFSSLKDLTKLDLERVYTMVLRDAKIP